MNTERNAAPAGQDQVENNDLGDNLQDADTLADLADPRLDSTVEKEEAGAEREGYAGLAPDSVPTGGTDPTGDRATGLGTGVRE